MSSHALPGAAGPLRQGVGLRGCAACKASVTAARSERRRGAVRAGSLAAMQTGVALPVSSLPLQGRGERLSTRGSERTPGKGPRAYAPQVARGSDLLPAETRTHER
eukprot:scaffold5393_cov376-Prasinococcus_capsulatus_cf.AAC.5